jgi:hypothetical protein
MSAELPAGPTVSVKHLTIRSEALWSTPSSREAFRPRGAVDAGRCTEQYHSILGTERRCLLGLFPPPALSKRRHRGLAGRLLAVRGRASSPVAVELLRWFRT